MALDRALGEEQTLGDLAVHVTHHEQPEDLLLAIGEHGWVDLSRMLARNARLARADGANASSQCSVVRIEHHSRRACRECGTHIPALEPWTHEDDRGASGCADHGGDCAPRRGLVVI